MQFFLRSTLKTFIQQLMKSEYKSQISGNRDTIDFAHIRIEFTTEQAYYRKDSTGGFPVAQPTSEENVSVSSSSSSSINRKVVSSSG